MTCELLTPLPHTTIGPISSGRKTGSLCTLSRKGSVVGTNRAESAIQRQGKAEIRGGDRGGERGKQVDIKKGGVYDVLRHWASLGSSVGGGMTLLPHPSDAARWPRLPVACSQVRPLPSATVPCFPSDAARWPRLPVACSQTFRGPPCMYPSLGLACGAVSVYSTLPP